MTKDEIREAITHFKLMLKITEECGVVDTCEIHKRIAIEALEESLARRTEK